MQNQDMNNVNGSFDSSSSETNTYRNITLVVFTHGFHWDADASTADGTPRHFPEALISFVESKFPTMTFSYSALDESVDEVAGCLAAEVQRFAEARNERIGAVKLVGYSMGGIISVKAAGRLLDNNVHADVMTIDSPLCGIHENLQLCILPAAILLGKAALDTVARISQGELQLSDVVVGAVLLVGQPFLNQLKFVSPVLMDTQKLARDMANTCGAVSNAGRMVKIVAFPLQDPIFAPILDDDFNAIPGICRAPAPANARNNLLARTKFHEEICTNQEVIEQIYSFLGIAEV